MKTGNGPQRENSQVATVGVRCGRTLLRKEHTHNSVSFYKLSGTMRTP